MYYFKTELDKKSAVEGMVECTLMALDLNWNE
jgi:hypothetical protein